jgi:putative AdoMet-dependent methyltransferase
MTTAKPNWFYDEYKHSGVDYTDEEQVAVYDARHQRFRDYRKFAETIMARLDLQADAAVIDLGSGTGAFALNAAPHYRTVYAVDVSDAMLAYTRQKAEQTRISNMVFCKGGFLTYAHTAAPADAVVSSAALHHLPDMWKWIGLLNVAKMLKAGGKFYLFDVVFPMTEEYVACFDGWVEAFAGRVGPEFAAEVETHIRDEYSTFDWVMEGLLRRAGFHINSVEYDGQLGATYQCTKA